MNEVMTLMYTVGALQFLTTLISGLFIIHLMDKNAHLKNDINTLFTSLEVNRDRVSYLYDQVSRVETKVDVNDKLQEIQEAIAEASEAKADSNAG